MGMKHQLDVASAFAPVPQVAGAFFEGMMTLILSTSPTPSLAHFFDESLNFSLPLRLALQDLPFDTSTISALNILYVPPLGFTSIDGFFLFQTPSHIQLILLQATIAKAHDIKKKGVEAVLKLLGNTRVHVVYLFVVPSAAIGEMVCRPFGKGGFKSSVGQLPVMWTVLSLPPTFNTSLVRYVFFFFPNLETQF